MLLYRSVDLVGAIVGIILAAPAFLVIAVIIKKTSPGPILFRQQRIGLHGKAFEILKFRSMRRDSEDLLRDNPALWTAYVEHGYKLPEGNDPRITGIGNWLRRTSLDELPQLWNVLVGDMSLVGPRPLVPDEVEQWYRSTADLLHSVRPGMTGLWQVQGRSDINYPERADLELAYVRTKSLVGDIRILCQTVVVVLARRGAH